MTGLATFSFNALNYLFEILPGLTRTLTQAKCVIEEYNKERNKVLESVNVGKKVSSNIAFECERIAESEPKKELKMMAKAIETNKWINYTFNILTDPDAKIIKASSKEKSLVNGIVAYVYPSFGKIYEDAGVDDIRDYDAKAANCKYNEDWLLSLFDISKRALKETFIKKEEEDVKAENNTPVNPSNIVKEHFVSQTINGRYDEQGLFHPIFVKDKNELISDAHSHTKKPANMDDTLFKRFEDSFSPILKSRYYYYNFVNGNWTINTIIDNMMNTMTYIIDDGSIMGGSTISIIGTYNNNGTIDGQFINVIKHPDIVAKMFNGLYVLTDDELKSVKEDYLENTIIYHNIDFTNTQFIDQLTSDDKKELNKYLFKSLELLPRDIRLRFANFVSPREFTLVSDQYCRSPLPETSNAIDEGFVIVAEPGKITSQQKGGASK